MSIEFVTEADTSGVEQHKPMSLADCPVRTTLDVLRGKWKPLLLLFLKPGSRRWAQLHSHLPEVSEKVLTQQLRELERDGIITRLVHPTVPPQVEYSISAYGETLIAVLQQMADWGTNHRAQSGKIKSGVFNVAHRRR